MAGSKFNVQINTECSQSARTQVKLVNSSLVLVQNCITKATHRQQNVLNSAKLLAGEMRTSLHVTAHQWCESSATFGEREQNVSILTLEHKPQTVSLI